MFNPRPRRARWQAAVRRNVLVLGLLVGLSACVRLADASGFGGDSWQEEVLLHDGQKMLIERSQTYGGRSEPGQGGPIADHTIRFIVPKGQQTITWNSPYDRDIGRTSFFLLAVHVKDRVPYVVAEPNLCQSYNKWGRPNPPYVIFKWEANGWQRIGIEALPTEFTTTNVIRSIQQVQARQWSGMGVIKAEKVAQINGVAETVQYRSILREAMNYDPSCIPMLTNGKGLWRAQAWFAKKPSLEACLAGCKSENFDAASCPCNQIFEGK